MNQHLYGYICANKFAIIYKTKKDVIRHLSTLGVCGKEGIRTPETLLTFTRFPGGPVQPLLHLSVFRMTNIENFFNLNNFW